MRKFKLDGDVSAVSEPMYSGEEHISYAASEPQAVYYGGNDKY